MPDIKLHPSVCYKDSCHLHLQDLLMNIIISHALIFVLFHFFMNLHINNLSMKYEVCMFHFCFLKRQIIWSSSTLVLCYFLIQMWFLYISPKIGPAALSVKTQSSAFLENVVFIFPFLNRGYASLQYRWSIISLSYTLFYQTFLEAARPGN